MGCNTSKQEKDILSSSEPILENGNGPEKIRNGVRETANDMAQLDFNKAQKDLQKVGEGLELAVNEGMNELLYGNSNGAVVTETEKSDVGDDEAESKVETENNDETERSLIVDMHPIQAQLEEMEIETTTELENANTPIPALDTLNENETDIEDSNQLPILEPAQGDEAEKAGDDV